jgi:hypothetical protein
MGSTRCNGLVERLKWTGTRFAGLERHWPLVGLHTLSQSHRSGWQKLPRCQIEVRPPQLAFRRDRRGRRRFENGGAAPGRESSSSPVDQVISRGRKKVMSQIPLVPSTEPLVAYSRGAVSWGARMRRLAHQAKVFLLNATAASAYRRTRAVDNELAWERSATVAAEPPRRVSHLMQTTYVNELCTSHHARNYGRPCSQLPSNSLLVTDGACDSDRYRRQHSTTSLTLIQHESFVSPASDRKARTCL